MNLNEQIKLISCAVTNNLKDEIYPNSSDESNSDEEIQSIFNKYIKVSWVSIRDYFKIIVPGYSNKEFVRHFRITRNLFQRLSKDYEKSDAYRELLKFQPPRTLSAAKILTIFLWFASHEACAYRDISDRFNVSFFRYSFSSRRISEPCRLIFTSSSSSLTSLTTIKLSYSDILQI